MVAGILNTQIYAEQSSSNSNGSNVKAAQKNSQNIMSFLDLLQQSSVNFAKNNIGGGVSNNLSKNKDSSANASSSGKFDKAIKYEKAEKFNSVNNNDNNKIGEINSKNANSKSSVNDDSDLSLSVDNGDNKQDNFLRKILGDDTSLNNLEEINKDEILGKIKENAEKIFFGDVNLGEEKTDLSAIIEILGLPVAVLSQINFENIVNNEAEFNEVNINIMNNQPIILYNSKVLESMKNLSAKIESLNNIEINNSENFGAFIENDLNINQDLIGINNVRNFENLNEIEENINTNSFNLRNFISNNEDFAKIAQDLNYFNGVAENNGLKSAFAGFVSGKFDEILANAGVLNGENLGEDIKNILENIKGDENLKVVVNKNNLNETKNIGDNNKANMLEILQVMNMKSGAKIRQIGVTNEIKNNVNLNNTENINANLSVKNIENAENVNLTGLKSVNLMNNNTVNNEQQINNINIISQINGRNINQIRINGEANANIETESIANSENLEFKIENLASELAKIVAEKQIITDKNNSKIGKDFELNIKLTPETLGEILVKVSYKNGSTMVNIIAQNSAAEREILNRIENLRDNLNSREINLSELNVNLSYNNNSNLNRSNQNNSNNQENRENNANNRGINALKNNGLSDENNAKIIEANKREATAAYIRSKRMLYKTV